MNYKNIILIIVLVLGFTVCLGCTDSNDDSKKSVESEKVQTGISQANKEATQASASENTSTSETTKQFSENKKEELIGYMTEYYGAKEVSVIFIPASNPSSNGLLTVDYYIDPVPTKTDLNDNIANIVILAESLAKESGIDNPDVSVSAMTMDGTPLGVGNYYSSTGKTYIDVSACP